jgi:glucose/mannose transport system permease protein
MTTLPAVVPRRFRRRPHPAPRRRLRRGDFAVLAALVALAGLVLVPIYVMVAAGFKPPVQADARHMWELPKALDFSGFRGAWTALGPNFQNSLMIAIPATVISSFIGAINGYVFAKMPFRGHNVIFMAMLLGMFIPYQVILVPLVRFLQEIHLYGTIQGLILVHVIYGIPITTLIFRGYYGGIPSELSQAALVDGATRLGAFRTVVIPLAAPGLVTAGMLTFIASWNEFLLAVTLTSSAHARTVPAAIALFTGSSEFEQPLGSMSAASVVISIPLIVLVLVFQKRIVAGLTAGAVKG